MKIFVPSLVVLVVGLVHIARAPAQSGLSHEQMCQPPSPGLASAPAPAPSPGPGPGPGAGPGAASGRGTTPGVGVAGGTTPGPVTGGTTGGGRGPGPAGATRGGSGGRGFGGPAKAKFSAEQTYWLGVLELPWQGTFLPKGGAEGYEGGEVSFDQAVRGEGGSAAWALKKLPTLVAVYNASSKPHLKALLDLEKNGELRAAAHYFNLVKVDVRTIDEKEHRSDFGNDPVILVYRANGERVAALTMTSRRKAADVVESLEPVFEKDFATSVADAVDVMGRVMARTSFIKDAIKRYEAVVICPKTGRLNTSVKESLQDFRKELADLEAHRSHLTAIRAGALIAGTH